MSGYKAVSRPREWVLQFRVEWVPWPPSPNTQLPRGRTQPSTSLGVAAGYVPGAHCFHSRSLFPGCARPSWRQPLPWQPQVQTQSPEALGARNVWTGALGLTPLTALPTLSVGRWW